MVLKDLKRIVSNYCEVEVAIAPRKKSDSRRCFVKIFNLRKIPAKYNNLKVVYLTVGVAIIRSEIMLCVDCVYPEEED